jgi:serine/threonine protein kinase
MRNDIHATPPHEEVEDWNDNYSECESSGPSGSQCDSEAPYEPLSDDHPIERWQSMLEEALKREGVPLQPRKYSERFDEIGMLGKGAYGHVFLVVEKDTKASYAMKKVSIPLDSELAYKLAFDQRAQKTSANSSGLRRSSEISPKHTPGNPKKEANFASRPLRASDDSETELDPETVAWKAMAAKIMQKLMTEVETMRKLWSKPSAHSANIIKFYESWLELTTAPISAIPTKMIKYGIPSVYQPTVSHPQTPGNELASKNQEPPKNGRFSEQALLSAPTQSETDSNTTGEFISNTLAKTGSNYTHSGTDLSGQPVFLPPRPPSPAIDPILLEERIPRSMLMASQRKNRSWGFENHVGDLSVPARPATPDVAEESTQSTGYYNDSDGTLGFDEDSTLGGSSNVSSTTGSYESQFELSASEAIHNNAARPGDEDPRPKRHHSSRGMPKFSITLYIQMEVCSSNSLYKWLWEPGRIVKPEQSLKLFQQLMSGLAHVHQRGFFHRDVKPDNLMVIYANGVPSVKLGDFGLTKKMSRPPTRASAVSMASNDPSSPQSSQIDGAPPPMRGKGGRLLLEAHTKGRGTAMYMAPELWHGGHYTEKVDIYAAGIVLLELFSCWTTGSERIYALKNLKENRIIDDALLTSHPEISQLLLAMTHPNPDLRPSALDILTHPSLSRYQLLDTDSD